MNMATNKAELAIDPQNDKNIPPVLRRLLQKQSEDTNGINGNVQLPSNDRVTSTTSHVQIPAAFQRGSVALTDATKSLTVNTSNENKTATKSLTVNTSNENKTKLPSKSNPVSQPAASKPPPTSHGLGKSATLPSGSQPGYINLKGTADPIPPPASCISIKPLYVNQNLEKGPPDSTTSSKSSTLPKSFLTLNPSRVTSQIEAQVTKSNRNFPPNRNSVVKQVDTEAEEQPIPPLASSGTTSVSKLAAKFGAPSSVGVSAKDSSPKASSSGNVFSNTKVPGNKNTDPSQGLKKENDLFVSSTGRKFKKISLGNKLVSTSAPSKPILPRHFDLIKIKQDYQKALKEFELKPKASDKPKATDMPKASNKDETDADDDTYMDATSLYNIHRREFEAGKKPKMWDNGKTWSSILNEDDGIYEETVTIKGFSKQDLQEQWKKEFNIFGDESIGPGVLTQDVDDLSLKKGQTVTIVRLDQNPPNMFLVKTDNIMGYVRNNHIKIDAAMIKQTMAKHQTGTESIYEAV